MMTMTPPRPSRKGRSYNNTNSSNNPNNGNIIKSNSSSSSGSVGSSSSRSMFNMQGVLWKRRDIFRNRWRPRWFVLHPDQRVLTYYLLANQEAGVGPQQVISGGGSSSTSSPRRRGTVRTTNASSSATTDIDTNINNNNRRRTLSESSTISANTIDCDVVPRGTIYLLGSTVEANEALTRPQENLYAVTITDHEAGSHCHLATSDPESREEWIRRIRRVCQDEVAEQLQQQHQTGSVRPLHKNSSTRSTRRSKRKGKTPVPPKPSIRNSEERKMIAAATARRNEILVVEEDSSEKNRSQQESSLQNGHSSSDGNGLNSNIRQC